ncbi:MAG: hypothetical protein ACI8UO_003706 [Verrucomicrobiales bacterium]|jgi:hypothetical protein
MNFRSIHKLVLFPLAALGLLASNLALAEESSEDAKAARLAELNVYWSEV